MYNTVMTDGQRMYHRNSLSTEAKPRLTMKCHGVTICSTTLSDTCMCYLFYYTECSRMYHMVMSVMKRMYRMVMSVMETKCITR
jgi:hypothetical protein